MLSSEESKITAGAGLPCGICIGKNAKGLTVSLGTLHIQNSGYNRQRRQGHPQAVAFYLNSVRTRNYLVRIFEAIVRIHVRVVEDLGRALARGYSPNCRVD